MSFILIVSITLRLVALVWSVVLLRRVRDWRMGFLAVMLGLMALRQTLTLLATFTSWEVTLSGLGSEWPGLIVSVMVFLAIFFLERILTDRSLAEAEIKLLAEALRSTGEAVSITDCKDTIIYVNHAFLKTYGYEKDEVIGQPITCLRSPDHPAAEDPAAVPPNERGTWQGELWNRKKDGTVFPILLSTAMVRDESGQPTAFIGVAADITKRKRYEEQLTYQANLLQNVSDAIIATDLNFTIQSWNHAAEAHYGWQADEVLGKPMSEVIPTTYREARREDVLAQFQATGLWKGEAIQQRRDGTAIDILASVTMIRDSAGQPTGVVAVNRDITERKRAEEALHENEERNRLLLETAFEGIVISDKGRILEANPPFAAMYGYDLDEVIGLSPLDMTTPESAERIMDHIARGIEKPYEIVGLKKDGSSFDQEVVGKNCTYQGRPARIAAMRDITERKQNEEALRETEARFQTLLSTVEDVVWAATGDGAAIRYVNAAAERVYGRPVAAFIEKSSLWLDVVHPDDRERVRAEMVHLFEQGHVEQEYRIVRPDGETRWLYDRKHVIFDEVGTPLQMGGIATDITERKQAEERERRLGRILDDSLNEIYIFDVETLHFLQVNRGARKNTGYSLDELRALTPLDLKPAFTPETFTQLVEPLRTGAQEQVDFTTVHRRKNGSLYPIEIHIQLSSWEHSTVFVAIVLDITERRRAEEGLRTSEQKYRQLVELAQEGIWAIDQDANTTFVNASMARMLGYTPDEMQNRSLFSFMDEQGVALAQHNLARREEGIKEQHDFEFIYKDGTRIYTLVETAPIVDKDGTYQGSIAGIVDITTRKQAAEALQASEARNRALLDGIPDMIFRLRADGTFLDYKAESADELAIPPEAIIGSPLAEVPMPAEVLENLMRCVQQAMETGEVQTYVYQLAVPVGVHAYEARVVRSGVDEVVCIIRNVTARKRAEEERERLIDELEARNAELERFTYTVSHDLKTPLVTIKGFLGLLLRDAKASNQDALKRDVAHISNAADRMAQLLNELLELSRIGRVVNPSEEVSLTELAHEALALVADQIAERGIAVTIAPDLPVVFGDRVRLLEVLQNLIDNAVKFMGDEPAPRLEIGSRNDSPNVVCYVQDNGIGIAPRHHEQIFGLFNRLALNVEGTGIGLALVKRIVEMHGGRIWVESKGEGYGSTFCFMLPH